MADSKRPSAKRPAPKRPVPRRASTAKSEVPEKDWVEEMVETLAKVSENARNANAAEPAADGVASTGSRSRWWPHRRRGGRT